VTPELRAELFRRQTSDRHGRLCWPGTVHIANAIADAVRDAESEADALRSENLQLRRQLADAEARHASVVQPPTMDGPVPTTTGTYR
jgi:hypothetical protein